MSTEENVQTVKDFLAAIGRDDKDSLLALVAEDIEWIIPGEGWPLAGAHGGRGPRGWTRPGWPGAGHPRPSGGA